METLAYTGERMVPGMANAYTFWAHIYRYKFAAAYVQGKTVLDIASGEGYGTASLLKAGARSVIGVDISEEACQHAERKYGINAKVGSAENIPLGDSSVDVVVSFETIEHLERPDKFLDECLRVLKKDGLLIISTPDKNVYSEQGNHNHFHCSEMTEEEFVGKLKSRFGQIETFEQQIKIAPWWSVRNLSAVFPWRGLRGAGRIVYSGRKLFCRKFKDNGTTKFRDDVIGAFDGTDWFLANLFNPYLVRYRSNPELEQAYYLVAVARAM